MKDIAAIDAFLFALDRPEHRELLAADRLLAAMVQELAARQLRYRNLQDAHGSQTCAHCPHGGCCRQEFVSVADLVLRLAIGIALPSGRNPAANACVFLGASGCSLLPSLLPRACVTFQCATLKQSGPTGFGDQAALLADHAADISSVLGSYLQRTYMLLDQDGEVALSAATALVAPSARLPLSLCVRTPGERAVKQALLPRAHHRQLTVL